MTELSEYYQILTSEVLDRMNEYDNQEHNGTSLSDVVNRKIETIVSRLVAEKKSILNFTNPMEAEEEWGGFGEYLTIKIE